VIGVKIDPTGIVVINVYKRLLLFFAEISFMNVFFYQRLLFLTNVGRSLHVKIKVMKNICIQFEKMLPIK